MLEQIFNGGCFKYGADLQMVGSCRASLPIKIRFAFCCVAYTCLYMTDRKLRNLSEAAGRYSLYKVGPVLSASHGIGAASLSVVLHEVGKCATSIFIEGKGCKPKLLTFIVGIAVVCS